MDTAAVLSAKEPALAPEGRDVIAIGGSAGGLEALISLIRDLPQETAGRGPGRHTPHSPGAGPAYGIPSQSRMTAPR